MGKCGSRLACRSFPPSYFQSNAATDDTDGFFNAAKYGDLLAVVLFIKKISHLDIYDKNGWTALTLAAWYGHNEVVNCLIEKGGSVDLANKDGQTPLALAAASRRPEVISTLLRERANVNLADKYGQTPLIMTSFIGDIQITNALLQDGAKVDLADENKQTALIHAACYGYDKVVNALINEGARIDLTDNDGQTALIRAAANGHVKVVNALLLGGASVDLADKDGQTALIRAAANGHVEVVNALLLGGASVDLADKHERTALMWTAARGCIDIVDALLQEGASVDLVDKDGRTALFRAAVSGHVEVVNALLKRGATVDLADKGGETAEKVSMYKGHSRVVQVLKEARLARAVKQILKSKVEDAPIKLFALGKAYAGKTEILKSLFSNYEGYQVVNAETEDYNKEKIKEKYETRTIGINVYHVKVKEQRISIFDCGGLDNYYMLHSLFTKVDNSIILVVFSLTRDDDSLKEEAEIKAELKHQIAFIKSKSACKCDDHVLLIGTRKDFLNGKQARDCEVMLEQISSILEREEEFRFPLYKLVNATDKQSNDVTDLLKEIISHSKAIVNAQDARNRSVPSVCFSACERLKMHAKDANEMVLHWETVYDLVNDEAMKSASVKLQRQEVYDICMLLDTFGMLLVSQPEAVSKEQLKKDPDNLFVIPDLNWFFSKFLGVIFSPAGYLQHPEICRNGYVSFNDLAKAFKGFDLSREQIVAVLKEYKVVCDGKGEDELLIPGALSNDKKPEWSCCGDKYEFIVGRRCENVGSPFNIGTMPEILSRLGQMWPAQSMEFFCGGVAIFHGRFLLLVDSVDLQTAIEVKIGAEKGDGRENNFEKILEELGDLMDIVYSKVVCGTAESRNLSTTRITYVLSCSWLLRLKPAESILFPIMYEIHFLEELYLRNIMEVRHHSDRNIKDDMKFLLTKSNMKELETFYVGLDMHVQHRNAITQGAFKEGLYLRDLPRSKIQSLKSKLENPPFGLGGWQAFASHFKEIKDDVYHIQAKANNSECAKDLLFHVRRLFKDQPICVLKEAFVRMERIDVALILDDDSVAHCRIGELPPVFIEKLAREFCSADLATSLRHMEELAEFLGIERDHVMFMIDMRKPPWPTDLMFRLLIDRKPNITVKEVAEVLQKMEWLELVELLIGSGD